MSDTNTSDTSEEVQEIQDSEGDWLEASLSGKLMDETPDPQVQLKSVYAKLYNAILRLDAVMDMAMNPETAGKAKIRNGLSADGTKIPEVPETVESITNFISKFSDREQFAVFYAITKALSSKFEDKAEKFVTDEVASQVANRPKDADKISTDEFKKLLAKRIETYNNAEVMRKMALEYMNEDEEYFPKIEERSGRSGPRASSKWNNYSWAVDGQQITDPAQNNIRALATRFENLIPSETVDVKDKEGNVTGKKTLTKLASLKNMMARHMGLEGGVFKPQELPSQITFKFENGPSLSGVMVQTDGEDQGDDEDENEESETVETPV